MGRTGGASNKIFMATPIKDTPVLTGNDAIRFLSDIEKVGRATEREIEEAQRAFEAIKKICAL